MVIPYELINSYDAINHCYSRLFNIIVTIELPMLGKKMSSYVAMLLVQNATESSCYCIALCAIL